MAQKYLFLSLTKKPLGSITFLMCALVDSLFSWGFEAKGEMEPEKQADVKKWANEVRSQSVQPQPALSFSLVTLVTV